jgi:uncharacterized damage-inducible protein DinB
MLLFLRIIKTQQTMVQAMAKKTTVKLGALVRDFTTYNAWANKTLVEWLKTKPSEVMDQVVPSSFPSLRATLIHIWDCQRFWLSVLQQAPPPPSMNDVRGNTLDDILNGFIAESDQFAAYVNSLDETAIQEEVVFTSPYAESVSPRFEFIHHCMNHSTYHRGQLVTMGRNLGLTDAPMTDYNFYLIMAKNKF